MTIGLRFGIALFALAVPMAVNAGKPAPPPPAPAPVIQSAQFADGGLAFHGQNFGTRENVQALTLGATSLDPALATTWTSTDVVIPVSASPGSYLLALKTPAGASSLTVTVGVTGPAMKQITFGNPSISYLYASDPTKLAEISFSAPAPGFVHVIAVGACDLAGMRGAPHRLKFRVWLDTVAAPYVSDIVNEFWNEMNVPELPSGASDLIKVPIVAQRLFPVGQGSGTFFLNATVFEGATQQDAELFGFIQSCAGNVTATFAASALP